MQGTGAAPSGAPQGIRVVWGWSTARTFAHAFLAVGGGKIAGSLCGIARSAACTGTPAGKKCSHCERLLELHGLTPKPPPVAEAE